MTVLAQIVYLSILGQVISRSPGRLSNSVNDSHVHKMPTNPFLPDQSSKISREGRVLDFSKMKMFHLDKALAGSRDYAAKMISEAIDVLNFFKVPGVSFVENVFKQDEVWSSNLTGVEPCRNGEGVCLPAGTCKDAAGGPIIGDCSGHQVCCKVSLSHQAVTDLYISYWTNQHYPRPQINQTSSSLNIKLQSDVCQVRLDFLDLVLPPPSSGCSCSPENSLEIVNSRTNMGVLGVGNSHVCGVNSGKHMYLDVSPKDILLLKIMTASTQERKARIFNSAKDLLAPYWFRDVLIHDSKWNIKVTQIPCHFNSDWFNDRSMKIGAAKFYKDLRAPAGCLQYFTEERGMLESWAFDERSPMLINSDYSVCIKHGVDTCGVTLTAGTFSVAAHPSQGCVDGYSEVSTDGGHHCCEVTDEDVHYVGINGYGDGKRKWKLGQLVENQNRYFFCGQKFGTSNSVVTWSKGPIVIRVKTGPECHTNSSQDSSVLHPCPHGGCLGFRMFYNVNTGTC